MPIRGIILIFLIAIIVCIILRNEIYAMLKEFFENNIEDDEKGEDE